MITELTNLVKSQRRTHIINAATFIIHKTNKQWHKKNTLGIILFCNFPIKLMSFCLSPLIASFQDCRCLFLQ